MSVVASSSIRVLLPVWSTSTSQVLPYPIVVLVPSSRTCILPGTVLLMVPAPTFSTIQISMFMSFRYQPFASQIFLALHLSPAIALFFFTLASLPFFSNPQVSAFYILLTSHLFHPIVLLLCTAIKVFIGIVKRVPKLPFTFFCRPLTRLSSFLRWSTSVQESQFKFTQIISDSCINSQSVALFLTHTLEVTTFPTLHAPHEPRLIICVVSSPVHQASCLSMAMISTLPTLDQVLFLFWTLVRYVARFVALKTQLHGTINGVMGIFATQNASESFFLIRTVSCPMTILQAIPALEGYVLFSVVPHRLVLH